MHTKRMGDGSLERAKVEQRPWEICNDDVDPALLTHWMLKGLVDSCNGCTGGPGCRKNPTSDPTKLSVRIEPS